MDYGDTPQQTHPLRSTLLTGAVAAVGIFALGRKIQPWAAKEIGRDLRRFDREIKHHLSGATLIGAQNFAAHIGADIPKPGFIQSFGLLAARGKFRAFGTTIKPMAHWEKFAKTNQIGRLIDELGFIREIREQFSQGLRREPLRGSQIQHLGPLNELGIFKRVQDIPAGISRGAPTFFAGDTVYVANKGTFEALPGKYWLYGKAGTGESRNVIEKAVGNLTGASTDPKVLAEIQRRQLYSFAKLRGLNHTDAQKYTYAHFDQDIFRTKYAIAFGKTGKVRAKELIDSIDGLQRSRRRLADTQSVVGRARHLFDAGLNERGKGMWTADWWAQQRESMLGFLQPQDMPVNRQQLRGYGVVQNFEPFKLKSYRDMFLGGRDRQINTGTVAAFHLLDRINTGIAWNGIAPWLALSGKSAASPAHFLGAVMFKRALPLFAGAFYAGYANDAIGNATGERPSDRIRDARVNADLWFAGVKDKLGISPFAKAVDDLSGGVVNRFAHPFLETPTGLSQAQLKDFQDHGDIAVRKGRWWLFGSSTSFRGDRVQYFTPNYARYRKAGNLDFTDTLYGSGKEYYANAALPTPTHPFAPIRHFITDRYHFEDKHYYDRPYPLSSPLFEPTTVHGAILNPLLGWLLKPTRQMHQDELPYLLDGSGRRNPRYRGEIKALNQEIKDRAQARQVTGFVTPSGTITPMEAVSLPGSDRQIADINSDIKDDGDEQAAGYDEGIEKGSYSGSGGRGIVPYGSGKEKARTRIREANVATRYTKGRMLSPASLPGAYGVDDPNDQRNLRRMIHSNDPRYQASLAYYSLTEVGGIYGFGAVSATGDPYSNLPTVQNAGRMTSFERKYWDNWSLGGLAPTPGLSEAFRRFLPHRFHMNSEYNPIRNTMPTWLPGAGGEDPAYFTDFLHGDPYVAIANGELRLPGTSYERLHNVDRYGALKFTSSQVGYQSEILRGFLTHDHAPFAAYSEDIAARGGALSHQAITDLHARTGIKYDRDVAFDDQSIGVSGTIDAVGGGQAIEVHTLSRRRYTQLSAGGNQIHREQLNLDLHETGLKSGQLIYINRDDPTQTQSFHLDYDKQMYTNMVQRLATAKADVAAGSAPGAFYNDMTKFSILADVAPWSAQYRRYRDFLIHEDLSPQDRTRVAEIKAQVTQRKKRYVMSPYKVRYSGLNYQNVTVKDVIDNNTFTTYEHPDNPVRLAGVHLDSSEASTKYFETAIHSGAHIRIGVADDQTKRISHDTLHTMRAVVYAKGHMLNRQAINEGYGTERDENDPAGIHVKYTGREIAVAGVLERLGHMTFPALHNKFMPIDSPLELYKRTQVYGKEWQDWRHPFRDYLFPSFEAFAQQGLPGIIGSGILMHQLTMGTSFEARHLLNKTPAGLLHYAKGITVHTRGKFILGAMAFTEGLSIFRKIVGNESVPSYRERQRNVDEYFDILKYIKYEGLYQKTNRWIQDHEHHDLAGLIGRYKEQGDVRKKRIQVLKTEKRKIIVAGGKTRKAHRIKEINSEIRELQSYRKELKLTKEDVLALQYKQQADQTLYGAETGGALSDVLMAMPAREREFFQAFLKAPGAERKNILRFVPHNERRFLESAWGMEAEAKPDLDEYFKTHFLPGADWKGWHADSALNDYKLVVFKQEGMDMMSSGFWPDDEERVQEAGTRNLKPMRRSPADFKAQLHRSLSGMGLRDIDIDLTPNAFGQHKIDIQVDHDRKKELNQQVNAMN